MNEGSMSLQAWVGVSLLSVFLTMGAAEAIRPARRFPTVPYWAWIGLATILVLLAINHLVEILIPEEWIRRYALIDARSWGVVESVALGVLTVSFVDYWFHRAEHRFAILWRIHQLHHSPDRVDLPGFVYTHPLEVLLLSLQGILVNRFVFHLSPAAFLIAGACSSFCFMFQHWNVRTPRWAGYVVQRPESHCIHHQVNHHASNYSNLPIWDLLFGTFQNPERFDGKVGFTRGRGRRLLEMLLLRDVHRSVAGRTDGDS
jgi:sterol desaturase/sphingolipid hydroxylase (fatty acid hydroxylase superfamily)